MVQKCCIRVKTSSSETSVDWDAETEAAREAMDWGEMDMTGILWDAEDGGAFEERKLRTSVWDWRVMSTDSADVMHPLYSVQKIG